MKKLPEENNEESEEKTYQYKKEIDYLNDTYEKEILLHCDEKDKFFSKISELNDKVNELENDYYELDNKFYNLNEENRHLNEENKNLRKRLKIEGQYAKYWLGGKSKEYTPFLNWPKDEDL